MAETITGPQLRDAIDSGRTGEKIAYPDVAAAPLETDSEAGGTPVAFSAEQPVVHQQETRSISAIALFLALGFAVDLCVLVSVLIGAT